MQFLNTYQVYLLLDALGQCFGKMHSKPNNLSYLQADGTN
jgi:hypothetical protein